MLLSRRLRIGGNLLKDWRFVLTLILIIGTLFRAYNIDSPFEGHLSENEAHYSMEARNFDKYGLFVLWTEDKGQCFDHPPLFQWTVNLSFKLFGESETTARLVPITFGVATLVLMFLLGSILFNKRFGLLSAFMLAINPMHVYVSHAVQLEAPMLFFMTATLYFSILWIESGRTRYFWLAVAMSSLGFFTKQTSILILLPIFLLLIRKEGWLSTLRNYKIWLFLLLTLIPSLLWFLYGLKMLGYESTTSVALTSIQPSWLLRPDFYSKEYSLLITRWGPIYLTLFLLGFASSFFFKDRRDQLMLIWLLGGTGYLLFFARAAHVHEYYLLTIIVPAAFFAVKPLEALSTKNKYSCLFLVGLLVLSSAVLTINLHEIQAPGLKDAGLYLNAATKPDELIVCSSVQVAYYSQRKVLFWAEIQNITNLKDLLQTENIQYLVVIGGGFPPPKPEILAYIMENLPLEEEFGVARIYIKG